MFVWIVGLKGKQRFKKNNVFANFLLGTIMQDSDIRKRSNDACEFYSKEPVFKLFFNILSLF